jgi:hypothetical protein
VAPNNWVFPLFAAILSMGYQIGEAFSHRGKADRKMGHDVALGIKRLVGTWPGTAAALATSRFGPS